MKLTVTENGMIDLASTDTGLVWEDGLESAVLISLLSDRRALADDVLPDDAVSQDGIPADRRGWVGDVFHEDLIGSRLWLLARRKQTEDTRSDAQEYCEEALQWLIDDLHATRVSALVEWVSIGRLEALIKITLINGDLYEQTVKVGE